MAFRYVSEITSLYQKGELVGKGVSISQINLANSEHKKVEISGNRLRIPVGSYGNIQLFYPEVKQKNAELAEKEKDYFDLVLELTNIIKENNLKVVPQAQKLGLKLPLIPLDSLKYFEEAFFKELDEKLPVASPFNQKIIAENESIRKKKEEVIKKNIYQIYNKNLKKLENYQKKEPFSPNSDLEKIKNQAIETINQILTDKNNLRDIDLSTLEGGKFLN